MRKMTVAETASLAGGRVEGNGEGILRSVAIHSGEIVPGGLFVPLRGEKTDGHRFIEDAAGRGAGAALCDRPEVTASIPLIRVEDTQTALQRLASGYRETLTASVVAVTGSVGKTTVKEMTASVLGARWKTLKTPGNLNNHLGLPLTLLSADDDCEAAVLEMGMSHRGEISLLTGIARPQAAVITNIGVSHIGNLGSRENICQAKLEILEGILPGGFALLNGDEPLLRQAAEKRRGKFFFFGEGEENDLRAHIFESTAEKLSLIVELSEKNPAGLPAAKFRADVPFPGRHNAINALAALSAGLVLGLSPEEAARGLALCEPMPMRQQIYKKCGFTIVEDCYNASPDSIKAAFSVLSSLPGRHLAALGGIRELGEKQAELHEACGRMAAGYVDALYLFGEGSEQYADGARAAGMSAEQIHRYDTREELASELAADAKAGDAILFKGSRYMKMEEALRLFLERVGQ